MEVELSYSMSVVVVLTVYSINDRSASSAGSHDTCRIWFGMTRILNPLQERR